MRAKTYVAGIAAIAAIAAIAVVLVYSFSSPSSDEGLYENTLQTPIISFTLQDPIISFDDLLDAIEQVESNGDAQAVGDNGNAIGSFQIWKIYVNDLNRIGALYGHKTTFSYEDRWDRDKSRSMIKQYIKHYATEKRLERLPTFEDMARIHNGGPNGYKKESTKKYWKKIKKELAK